MNNLILYKGGKCTCGASLSGLCKDSVICPNMIDNENHEESQDDLWRELIDMYDSIDKSSYGYGSLLKLKEHFNIQRVNKK